MKFYVKLIFCLVFISTYAQIDSIPAKEVRIFNTDYKEFEVANNLVYAISNGDSLVKINLNNFKNTLVKNDIKTLARRNDTLYYCDKLNNFFCINNDSIIFEKHYDVEIFKIIPSDKKVYFFTNKGLMCENNFYISEDLYFATDKNEKNSELLFKNPTYHFFDYSNQKIWMVYDNGEFGSALLFFDLINNKFVLADNLDYGENMFKKELKSLLKRNKRSKIKSNINFDNFINKMVALNNLDKAIVINDLAFFKFPFFFFHIFKSDFHIKSISQNNEGELLISESFWHFLLSKSEINFYERVEYRGQNYFYKNKLKNVVEHEQVNNVNRPVEYVGPNSFNKFNNSFYFYSDKGFFKLVKKDGEFSKEPFLKCRLFWGSQKNAVGYQMNVVKFEFISENEMLFLTTNNGIGYFNGKEVVYFR